MTKVLYGILEELKGINESLRAIAYPEKSVLMKEVEKKIGEKKNQTK